MANGETGSKLNLPTHHEHMYTETCTALGIEPDMEDITQRKTVALKMHEDGGDIYDCLGIIEGEFVKSSEVGPAVAIAMVMLQSGQTTPGDFFAGINFVKAR